MCRKTYTPVGVLIDNEYRPVGKVVHVLNELVEGEEAFLQYVASGVAPYEYYDGAGFRKPEEILYKEVWFKPLVDTRSLIIYDE